MRISHQDKMINETEFREIIRDELDLRSRIDVDEHDEHHAFIQSFIDRENRKQAIYQTVVTQVAGWGIVVILAWIGKTVANKFGVYY